MTFDDRVRQIFLAVMDLHGTELDAALDRKCDGNDVLRERVERLLDLDDDSGGTTEGGGTLERDPFNPRDALAPGDVIDDFVVKKTIGTGGMGVVFLAEQIRPVRRMVALKVIRPGMASESVLARFDAERQALALMDHPGIASVYQAGTTKSDLPYFALEFVPGRPICEAADEARLNIEQRLELMAKVCDAVQHAHTKGVIHRDLKPSNILVRESGEGELVPKVIDFGVAKAVDPGSDWNPHHTQVDGMLGTPCYMSPEQSDPTGEGIDTRTDVFSLGAVLYELLSGVSPLDPEDLHSSSIDEIRRRIRTELPPDPSSRVDRLPVEEANRVAESRQARLETLVRDLRGEVGWIPMMAMRKERHLRYPSAVAMAEDLRRLPRGLPLVAGPESAGYRLRKFVGRHRLPLGAAALLLVALVAITMVSLTAARVSALARIEADDARDRAEASERVANDERESALRTARELAWSSYSANTRLASELVRLGESARAMQCLEQAPTELRGWEWYHLAALCDRSLGMVTMQEERLRAFDLDPSGRLVATGGEDGRVTVHDLEEDRLVLDEILHDAPVLSVDFHPEKGRIATADRQGVVKITALADAASLGTLEGHEGWIRSVRFDPSGDWLISAGQDNRGRLWDLRIMSEAAVLQHPGVGAREVYRGAFSPTGTLVATGSQDCTARIWSVPDGELVHILDHDRSDVFRVQWSTDGLLVATGGLAGRVLVWDVDSGDLLLEHQGPDIGTVRAIRFSPDDQRMVIAVERMVEIIDLRSGKRIGRLMEHPDIVTDVVLEPGGDLLAATCLDGTAWIHDPSESGTSTAMTGHVAATIGIRWLPKEDGLLTASSDGTVRLWATNLRRRQDFEEARVSGWHPEGGLIFASDKLEWRLVSALDGRVVHRGPLGNGPATRVRFDRKGERLAIVDTVADCHFIGLTPEGATPMGLLNDVREVLLIEGGGVVTLHIDGTLRRRTGPNADSSILLCKDESLRQHHLCRSPVEDRVLVSGGHGPARLVDLDGSRILEFGDADRPPVHAVFHPSGRHVVATHDDGDAVVWDVETGEVVRTLEFPRRQNMAFFNDPLVWIDFDPSGRYIVANDGAVGIWEFETGRKIATLSPAREHYANWIYDLKFDSGGTRIFTASRRGFDVWSLATGDHLGRLETRTGRERSGGRTRTWVEPGGFRLALVDERFNSVTIADAVPLAIRHRAARENGDREIQAWTSESEVITGWSPGTSESD